MTVMKIIIPDVIVITVVKRMRNFVRHFRKIVAKYREMTEIRSIYDFRNYMILVILRNFE